MLSESDKKKLVDKNSMLYWYPLVCDLDVPQPRTCIVEMSLYSDSLTRPINAHLDKIRQAVEDVGGYPVFMRTDLVSGKFDWGRTCYCASEQHLIANIPNLVQFSENCGMIGKPVNALVFREYIEMASKFSAFHGLPIGRERRYFARDGVVECHHPYWPEAAMQFYESKSPAQWQRKLCAMNYESIQERSLLATYAEKLGAVLPGYWSIDFCLSRSGTWHFIDCALGAQSWHPADWCPLRRRDTVLGGITVKPTNARYQRLRKYVIAEVTEEWKSPRDIGFTSLLLDTLVHEDVVERKMTVGYKCVHPVYRLLKEGSDIPF